MKGPEIRSLKNTRHRFQKRPESLYQGRWSRYSLATIEKILAQKQELKIGQEKEIRPDVQRYVNSVEGTSNTAIEKRIRKEIQSTLNILVKSDSGPGGQDDSQSIAEEQKRRRKHKHRHW